MKQVSYTINLSLKIFYWLDSCCHPK